MVCPIHNSSLRLRPAPWCGSRGHTPSRGPRNFAFAFGLWPFVWSLALRLWHFVWSLALRLLHFVCPSSGLWPPRVLLLEGLPPRKFGLSADFPLTAARLRRRLFLTRATLPYPTLPYPTLPDEHRCAPAVRLRKVTAACLPWPTFVCAALPSALSAVRPPCAPFPPRAICSLDLPPRCRYPPRAFCGVRDQ